MDKYPVANEDAWYQYCIEETIVIIEPLLPEQIYVADSKRITAEFIHEELTQFDDYDPIDFDVTENIILHAAYELSLCDSAHQDFWNEWVEQEGLPTIIWGDNFGSSQNRVLQLEGQLSLFEESGDDNG